MEIIITIIVIWLAIHALTQYYQYVGYKEEQADKAAHYKLYKNRNYSHSKKYKNGKRKKEGV